MIFDQFILTSAQLCDEEFEKVIYYIEIKFLLFVYQIINHDIIIQQIK
jgi:hypothetical protein